MKKKLRKRRVKFKHKESPINKMIHLHNGSFWYKDLEYITIERYSVLGVGDFDKTIIVLKNGKRFIEEVPKDIVVKEIEWQLRGRL